MTEQVQSHSTKIEMLLPVPSQVEAGADIPLKIKVTCASGCDLQGLTVQIVGPDAAVLKEMALTGLDGTTNMTDEFVIKAPTLPGEYTWTATFPAQEKEGVLHAASSAPFAFTVKPHETSITVWDIPSPIGFGAEFRAKVGVRCSAGCALAGQKIQVHDHAGAVAGVGALGDTPWSDSGALYWTEVTLAAPVTEGVYNWSVKFSRPDLELPHEPATDTFAFATARPPEHAVTVKVVDQATRKPLKYALVSFLSQGAPYRNRTDDAGMTHLSVPTGEYKVYVSMRDYLDWETTTQVSGDVTIHAELVFAPDDYG